MSTNFAVSINNVATSVAVAYRVPSSYPTVIGVVDASLISLSGSQWIRLSTFRSGSPLSILHATSPVSANGVAAVTVSNGGTNYPNNGTYTNGSFTGGSGSGGVFTYTVSGGVIQDTIIVTTSGSGYTGTPTPVFTSAGTPSVAATVSVATAPYCLKITGTSDSYTDVPLLIGDAAELRVTAGAFNDLATAVNTLETSGGGMAIGSAVTGGTSGSILYVDASGNLAQNNTSLFWDKDNVMLRCENSTGSAVAQFITTATSAVSAVVSYRRTNDAAHLIFGMASSTYDTAAYPTWSFGILGGTGDFSITSWNSATGLYDYLVTNNSSGYLTLGNSHNFLVRHDGTASLPVMTNASAANSSLFIDSSASNKLCWKDSGGTLHYST